MEYLGANLAVYYKGALTFQAIDEMPIARLLNLEEMARRLSREQEAALKKR